MRHHLTPAEQGIVNRRLNLVIVVYTTLIVTGVAWTAMKAPSLDASRLRSAAAIATANAAQPSP